MTPTEYPETVTKELCSMRHERVEEKLEEIKTDVRKINGKLWGALMLIIAQLMNLVLELVKNGAS